MVDVVRIDHVPVLTLWAAAVVERLGFLRVKRRSEAGLNVSGPIDFRLGMGGKGI